MRRLSAPHSPWSRLIRTRFVLGNGPDPDPPLPRHVAPDPRSIDAAETADVTIRRISRKSSYLAGTCGGRNSVESRMPNSRSTPPRSPRSRGRRSSRIGCTSTTSSSGRHRIDWPVDVVREMVGMHAQVTSLAELQLAARIDGLRPADVRDALASERSPRQGLVDARHAAPADARGSRPRR